jgi:RNA polymerase sigma factor (sigma-70 family)
MIEVNDHWKIADEEFSQWLDGRKNESNFNLTNILKSTYLIFREQQQSWLKVFCQRSLEYLKEKEIEKNDDSFINFKIDLIETTLEEESADYVLEYTPMFRRKSSHEFEENNWKKSLKRENDNIINGILAHDQDTFNKLYEEEFPKIVRMIVQNSGNIDMAKDVFQDALVILIEKVYSNKIDVNCSLSTYLYSICRFLWMDHLRQNKRKAVNNNSFNYPDIDITIAGFDKTPDIFENVIIAIDTLGDPCKQLLECFYYKHLSWDEIAITLGYSNAASARNQKYKCLERIRKTVNVEFY